MAARNHSNTVDPTSLSSALNNSATTFNVVSTAGFPATPFIAAVDRGTADEEVMLVTAKTSTTVTVNRGYDGTAAVAHLSGAAFEHCTSAIDSQEPNAHIWDDGRDDHGQYLNEDRAKVYFPKGISGTSPTPVASIGGTYADTNTVTIPSATFSRKVQVTAQIPLGFITGSVVYRGRIVRGSTNYGSSYYLTSASGGFVVLSVMTDWLVIAAGSPYTFSAQIKRDSGSGGSADDDPNFNKISALVIPNI